MLLVSNISVFSMTNILEWKLWRKLSQNGNLDTWKLATLRGTLQNALKMESIIQTKRTETIRETISKWKLS